MTYSYHEATEAGSILASIQSLAKSCRRRGGREATKDAVSLIGKQVLELHRVLDAWAKTE